VSRPAVFWAPDYEVDIGRHVFPTVKYRLVRERLREDGDLPRGEARSPEPADRTALARVHDRRYLEKIDEGDFTRAEELRLEVPFSPELRRAMILCCGGTTDTARAALDDGVAVHLGGGFHHAFADHGEGFCLLNDVAVAAAALLAEGRVERVAVVDLDVHQGNGTAAIFADEPRVFTFSMHQERNYPHPKPPSDLDVGLPDGIEDAAYLERLDAHLPELLAGHRPGLAIYLAGADPYREDQLGGLGLTREGLRRRDAAVLDACAEAGVPVAVTLAGGYAIRREDTVAIHAATVRTALARTGSHSITGRGAP